MASHERQVPSDVDDPDIGFQAGFGFYLGLVVTGIVAIGGVLADVTTGTLLGLLPTTLTAVTIVGHVLAKRARGLPERIGFSRWRRLASYVPSIAFAAVPTGLATASSAVETSTRLAVITTAFVLLTAVSAFGMNYLSRKRYVEAITRDEPAARWTWHRTGYRSSEVVTVGAGLLMIGIGILNLWSGYTFGLFWAGYGALHCFMHWSELDADWADPSERWNPPEIRAHDAGLVIRNRKLVPWDAITDVRLTEDELVLEREGFGFDVRCDRSAIDDPEAVYEGIERARAGKRERVRGEHTERGDEDAGRDAESETETETETELA